MRVPAIRRVPDAWVPSACPASVHAKSILPPGIRSRRAAEAEKPRPSKAASARPTTS
jgi:hypothetical protein